MGVILLLFPIRILRFLFASLFLRSSLFSFPLFLFFISLSFLSFPFLSFPPSFPSFLLERIGEEKGEEGIGGEGGGLGGNRRGRGT